MVFMILMIIFLLLLAGVVGYNIYQLVLLYKNPMPQATNYPKEVKKHVILSLVAGGVTLLSFIFLSLFQGYNLNAGEWIELIFGSFFFGASTLLAVNFFVLHYYAKEMDETLKKKLFKYMICAVFSALIGLWLLTNGIADHIIYPLVNGINFEKGFVTPASNESTNIAWYAICILVGAIVCYFVCDHRYYQEYGEHGILESLLFVAFPAGIIGARIGYVIGEWNHRVDGLPSFADRVAAGEWWAPLEIWKGGLTIISGALIGIIVGIAWFLWRKRKYNIWLAVDVIVPAILIAQSFGRWGNFFNCEVHGLEVSKEALWFLPKIVVNNASYSSFAGAASIGNVYLPLFFIEAVTNMLGYFFIRFAVGKGLKKYIEFGDLASLYIVWYGLTRVILEPFRHPGFNMGNDGYWSWIWAIVFVLGGFLLILINHYVRHIIAKKKNTLIVQKDDFKVGLYSLLVSSVIALGLIIPGIILMVNGTPAATLEFNNFNNGIIFLVSGLSVLAIGLTMLPRFLDGLRMKNA